MVWLYIRAVLGILDKKYDRTLTKVKPDDNWKRHVENELKIDRELVRQMASEISDLSDEDKSFLILATLKRESNGWFPTYDEELRVLRLKRISDW
jgi:hypothetical protein